MTGLSFNDCFGYDQLRELAEITENNSNYWNKIKEIRIVDNPVFSPANNTGPSYGSENRQISFL